MGIEYVTLSLRERSTYERINSELNDITEKLYSKDFKNHTFEELKNIHVRFDGAMNAKNKFVETMQLKYKILPENFVVICEDRVYFKVHVDGNKILREYVKTARHPTRLTENIR